MSRSYCWTLNNYTLEELGQIHELCTAKDSKIRYLVCGAEVGENGTPHLQGYLELKAPQRISWFKKTCLKRAHLEKRKGSREQAAGYCRKDDDIAEYGNWEDGGQGARKDLKFVMSLIREKKQLREIMEEAPNTVAKCLRFTEKYIQLVERDSTAGFREVEVQALIGDAGSGKTRHATETAAADGERLFIVNPDEAFPFEGYDGETQILIDDFYGGIKYGTLLRVLDGHQFRVNVKGGHRYAQWTKVWITSNKTPDEWYKMGMTPALKRRIHGVTTFRNEVAGNTGAAPSPIEDLM